MLITADSRPNSPERFIALRSENDQTDHIDRLTISYYTNIISCTHGSV